MSYYSDIYSKRLNRFGIDFQSRIQGEREKDFEIYLSKSVYLINFLYDNVTHLATLEPNKQTYIKDIGYLLTKRNLNIPNGTILTINNQDGTTTPWMVWWLENLEATGYNRYTVLKMSYNITWKVNQHTFTQYAFLQGQGTTAVDSYVRTSINRVLYSENNNLYMLVTPNNNELTPNLYLDISYQNRIQGFLVKETDFLSTPGVMYLSLDPTYAHTENNIVIENPTSNDVWLNGGAINGR